MAEAIHVRVDVQASVVTLVALTIQTTHKIVPSVPPSMQKVSRVKDSVSIVHATTMKEVTHSEAVMVAHSKAVTSSEAVTVAHSKEATSSVAVTVVHSKAATSSAKVEKAVTSSEVVISNVADMVAHSKAVSSSVAVMVAHSKAAISAEVAISSVHVPQITIQMQSTARRNSWSTMTHFWTQMHQSA